jgi:hypothetical protein
MDAYALLIGARLAWDQRAELIRAARDQGKTWGELAEATGLSRMTVINLYKSAASSQRTETGVQSKP